MQNSKLYHMVCVRSITYNQSKFITDTMDGLCAQRTTFPYVCVLVDDASSDGEPDVIISYIDKYFIRCDLPIEYAIENEDYSLIYARHKINENCFFAVTFLKRNHYSINKDKSPYFKIWQDNSKYIAFCEGDDYWLETHKLQRQVDFLESHPDYTLFFHNAIIRYENHNCPDAIMREFETGDYDTLGVFKKWQLPLASVVCKRELVDEPILSELNKVYEGGFCFFITAAQIGKVYGLSECMSVYRKNDGGISNLMRGWEIMEHHYGFATVTKNQAVLKYVDKEAFHRLINCMPMFLLGNDGAKRIVEVVRKYNKNVFYRALLLYPFWIPKKVFDKIKRKLYGKKIS